MNGQLLRGLLGIALGVGSLCHAASPGPTPAARLAERVKPAEARVQPVDEQTLAQMRQWLEYVANRLQSQLQTASDREPFAKLAREFDFSELFRQVRSPQPEAVQLDKLPSQLRASVDSGTDRQGLRHSVLTTAAAIETYAAAREFATPGPQAEALLKQKLEQLQNQLREYDRQPNSARVAAIHETLAWLRLHRQATALTEEVRRHYLRPQLRVFVSTKLLDEIASGPNLTIPINRTEAGMTVSGVVNATGRLQTTAAPRPDCADLTVGFREPVEFSGTICRGRFNLGVDFGLSLDVSKRFFLREHIPDAAPTQSNSGLAWVETDRGPLVDRLVSAIAKRKFDGSQLDAELDARLDQGAARLANLVSLKDAALVRDLLASDLILERRYRTYEQGVEFILLGSRDGFAEPLELPPLQTSEDFSCSLHRPLLGLAKLKAAFGEGQKHPLQSLHDWLGQAFEIHGSFAVGPAGGKLELGITDGEQKSAFVALERGQLGLNFTVRRAQAAAMPYQCRLVLPLARAASESGSDESVGELFERLLQIQVVSGGQDEQDRRDLERLLQERIQEVLQLIQVNLPNVAEFKAEKAAALKVHLRRWHWNRDYLTIGTTHLPVATTGDVPRARP